MNARPKTVDAYLAALPPKPRAALAKVRKTIRAAAPEAVESISYGLCAYKQGRPLLYFGASKAHLGLYGPVHDLGAALDRKVARFRTGKGTLRFTPEDPIPLPVVRAIVKARLAKVTEATKKKPAMKKPKPAEAPARRPRPAARR